jgi:hypothetical protein
MSRRHHLAALSQLGKIVGGYFGSYIKRAKLQGLPRIAGFAQNQRRTRGVVIIRERCDNSVPV